MPNTFVSGQEVEENVSHLKSLLFLLLISGFFPYLSTREPDSWLLFAPPLRGHPNYCRDFELLTPISCFELTKGLMREGQQ